MEGVLKNREQLEAAMIFARSYKLKELIGEVVSLKEQGFISKEKCDQVVLHLSYAGYVLHA